jgi:catechol 2,3-dioxygenase-like lactoylglutathione lyase family enzyme
VLDGGRIYHVNINCRGLGRSRAFYEALGLKSAVRTAPATTQPGDAFGLAQARWDAWIMSGESAAGSVIDLLQWQVPEPVGAPPANIHTQGFQRVGVLVPDLDAAMRAAQQHGGDVWSEPVHHTNDGPGPDVRLVLGNDPDGVAIELVEVGGPAVSFIGLVCADLQRSIDWYASLGFREAARFASANDESAHLHIDGPSVFDEVMMTAPGGGMSLMLVGFDTPRVAPAAPRPANAIGIWRVALLIDDLDAACMGLRQRDIPLLSEPVTMAMGEGLPELRFVCFRGLDGEVIELIETPTAAAPAM